MPTGPGIPSVWPMSIQALHLPGYLVEWYRTELSAGQLDQTRRQARGMCSGNVRRGLSSAAAHDDGGA